MPPKRGLYRLHEEYTAVAVSGMTEIALRSMSRDCGWGFAGGPLSRDGPRTRGTFDQCSSHRKRRAPAFSRPMPRKADCARSLYSNCAWPYQVEGDISTPPLGSLPRKRYAGSGWIAHALRQPKGRPRAWATMLGYDVKRNPPRGGAAGGIRASTDGPSLCRGQDRGLWGREQACLLGYQRS